MTRPMGDTEVLTLTAKQARTMPEEELRNTFCEIVIELEGEYGAEDLPEGFPVVPWDLTREEMIAAVERWPRCFSPVQG